MRRVDRRTTLRAEWTSGDTVERLFDYAPKERDRSHSTTLRRPRLSPALRMPRLPMSAQEAWVLAVIATPAQMEGLCRS
ncbi:MAG: hypothetical protein WBP81_26155, partial [Solirubrobacteraceae bacterium]